MKDSGVHVDLESMKLHINKYTFNLCNHNGSPCLKMSRPNAGDFCVTNSQLDEDVKSGDQVNKIHSVEMTQRNPWNHLLVTQERRCVLCRGISCRAMRCTQLLSLGKGVSPTTVLKPGNYWVFHTQKTMIEIFGENYSRPLDFYAKKKKDKNPILPIQSPPYQSDNFENRRTAAMRERHNEDRAEYVSPVAKSSADWMNCRLSNSILDNMKRNGTSNNTNQDLLGIFNHCDGIFSVEHKSLLKSNYNDVKSEYRMFGCGESFTNLHKAIISKLGKRFVALIDHIMSIVMDTNNSGSWREMDVSENEIRHNDLSQSLALSDSENDFFVNICSQPYDDITVSETNKQKYQIKEITGHRSPSRTAEDNYKGSRHNLVVKWFNDEETEEPLKSMVEDVPKFVAEYAIKNNLTKEKG